MIMLKMRMKGSNMRVTLYWKKIWAILTIYDLGKATNVMLQALLFVTLCPSLIAFSTCFRDPDLRIRKNQIRALGCGAVCCVTEPKQTRMTSDSVLYLQLFLTDDSQLRRRTVVTWYSTLNMGPPGITGLLPTWVAMKTNIFFMTEGLPQEARVSHAYSPCPTRIMYPARGLIYKKTY